ncbi:hypothetical protein F2Q68_00020479 [Brassica cretica]|uniref:Uncharacterized protein n=1 Tax=Brassica cretica TaxID=69181 RepID=A0A8S9FST2_BRACR|nr:hypothetical protein F2Q68_00020479 [Brassica cretica]
MFKLSLMERYGPVDNKLFLLVCSSILSAGEVLLYWKIFGPVDKKMYPTDFEDNLRKKQICGSFCEFLNRAVDAFSWMGWLLNSRRGCITVDELALLLNTFSRCLVEDSDSSIRWFWVRSNVEALCGSLFYENGVGSRFFGGTIWLHKPPESLVSSLFESGGGGVKVDPSSG